MIDIDGSVLEGGGQILRTSVALSGLTGSSVRISSIRAKRDYPGLQAQHMAAVEAVAKLVDAKVTGLAKGSSTIEFHPKKIRGGNFKIDVGTAGSILLVLQALIPVACFAPSEVQLELSGGTDVPWSPTFDYMRLVFIPTVQRMGCRISAHLVRRGHYPKGGGIVKVIVTPVADRFEAIKLDEFGEVEKVTGVSHAVRLPKHVATRQADAAKAGLSRAGYKNIEIEIWHKDDEVTHLGPGSGIALCAATTTNSLIGADCLGERGKPAEEVGSEVSNKLINLLSKKCPLDLNLSDMLIPYVAVADGKSTLLVSDLSLHAKTNMAITQKFMKTEFRIEKVSDKKIISCDGIGLKKATNEQGTFEDRNCP